MMQSGSLAAIARGLVRRVEVCSDGLEVMSAERAQALVYAGFLEDVSNGSIELQPGMDGMLDLVSGFCDLVELEKGRLS